MPQGAISDISHALSGFLVCLLLTIALVSRPAYSQTSWLASEYPDPSARSGAAACGLATDARSASAGIGDQVNNTWICDPDRVISLEEATLLGNYLGSLSHASPCDCEAVECPVSDVIHTGYLIGVALLDRLNIDGMQFEPMNVKAANFARDTRQGWFAGIGCDDNALVFYSKFSNELYISIGERMAGVVSDLELASLYALVDQYFPAETDGSESNSNPAIVTTSVPNSSFYRGLDAVVRQLNEAVLNGPSISSQVVFAFAIPLALVLVLTIMCLISNVWCAQDIYVEPSNNTDR